MRGSELKDLPCCGLTKQSDIIQFAISSLVVRGRMFRNHDSGSKIFVYAVVQPIPVVHANMRETCVYDGKRAE